MTASRYVQARNPRTGRWTKIDRKTGRLTYKKSPGRWKNVPVARRRMAESRIPGKNKYCGPFVVASLLGISTDRAAAMITAKRPARERHLPVKGIQVNWAYNVLRDHKVLARTYGKYQGRWAATNLMQWLLSTACVPKCRRETVLIHTHSHVLLYRRGWIADNSTKRWIPVRDYVMRHGHGKILRQRIDHWNVLRDHTIPAQAWLP